MLSKKLYSSAFYLLIIYLLICLTTTADESNYLDVIYPPLRSVPKAGSIMKYNKLYIHTMFSTAVSLFHINNYKHNLYFEMTN